MRVLLKRVRTEKGKRTKWRKRSFEGILSLQKIPSYAVQYTCPKKKVYLQLDHEFAEVATTLWAKPILQSGPTLIRHALLIYSQKNRVRSIVFDVNFFFCIWCIRTDKICYVKSDVKVLFILCIFLQLLVSLFLHNIKALRNLNPSVITVWMSANLSSEYQFTL